MFSIGEHFVDISKYNRVRTWVDDFIVLPLQSILLAMNFYDGVKTCLALDPNYPITLPTLFSTSDGKYALQQAIVTFDVKFMISTCLTLLLNGVQAISLISHYDSFFMGKIIGSSLTIFSVLTYDVVDYLTLVL